MAKQTKHDGYQVFAASLPEVKRPKNQDAMAYRCVETAEGPVYALVACDGISSSPNGGPAARIAADRFDEEAAALTGPPGSPEAWLRTAVERAQRRVEGAFQGGGQCCLVAALVVPRDRTWTVASVGDSFAFFFDGRALEQLNEHDVTVRARKRSGETVVADGRVVLDKGVTQAIGQPGDVRPHITSGRYEEDGSFLCLTSDGVMGPWLEELLREAAGTLGQREVEDFALRMREVSEDDTTLVLLRLGRDPAYARLDARLEVYGSLPQEERRAVLDEAEARSYLPTETLVACVGEEADEPRALRIVTLLERARTPPPLDVWIGLLDRAQRSGRRQLARHLSQAVARQKTAGGRGGPRA